MGSLMPGWRTGGRLPGQPPKGFEESTEATFGSYKRKSFGGDPTSPRSYLERNSQPPTATPTTPKSPRQAPGSPGATGSLARASAPYPSTISESNAAEPEDSGGRAWWRRFESASFNEPFEERPQDWKQGSYMPQHEVAKGTAGGAAAGAAHPPLAHVLSEHIPH